MSRVERISPRQVFLLVLLSRATTAVAQLPALTVGDAREDAWISALVATAAGTVLVWVYGTLALRFPGRSVIRFLDEMLGPVVGRLMGLLFLWVFLEQSAIVLREYGEALVTAIMPETPISFIMGVMIALAAFNVRAGIEVEARMSDVILPVFLVATLLVPALAVNVAQVDWLLPVLSRGWQPVLHAAVTPFVWFGELLFLLMIFPHVSDLRQARRAACLGAAASGLLVTLLVAVTLAVFGAEEGERLTFPVYSLARMIEVGGFLERISAIPMMAWGLGLFVKLSFNFYAGVRGLSEWLGLEDHRPLVFSMGAILLVGAMVFYDNLAQFRELESPEVWGVYRGALTVALPVLLLLLALWRRPHGGRQEAREGRGAA
ncbi:GerAB/ArcD/ProY family transporter [Limnochorda pilosa]|uniref:Spore germination protein n=1 Tax=Limnochorda pilosa TaxID=1555112 RepID=A0A0K2SHX1_LIMPI|nr:endospore germination permease [Limnochorda pilosa]BAS26449.1 hypothetical protein LIP_0592 [Limnochorda pilosa]